MALLSGSLGDLFNAFTDSTLEGRDSTTDRTRKTTVSVSNLAEELGNIEPTSRISSNQEQTGLGSRVDIELQSTTKSSSDEVNQSRSGQERDDNGDNDSFFDFGETGVSRRKEGPLMTTRRF